MWEGDCEVIRINKRVLGGTPENDFSVELPYKTFLLVSIQVGLSVVPWGGVWKYEMSIAWVNNVPMVEGDLLVVVVFEMPGALDMSTPNVLAPPLGVVGNFSRGCLVKDSF